jgi:hypothetical protein
MPLAGLQCLVSERCPIVCSRSQAGTHSAEVKENIWSSDPVADDRCPQPRPCTDEPHDRPHQGTPDRITAGPHPTLLLTHTSSLYTSLEPCKSRLSTGCTIPPHSNSDYQKHVSKT